MTLNTFILAVIALLGFMTAWIGRKNGQKVEQVHILVNSQMKATLSRVTQLIETLEHAGVAVPPNRNGGPVPGVPEVHDAGP